MRRTANPNKQPWRGSLRTQTQVSAGGVAYRSQDGTFEIALILVGENDRWQLPKGTINQGEKPDQAALREVHEEAGIIAELVRYLDKIEYWYYSREGEQRIRYHKFVHFYLMRYLSGNVEDHDHEVSEARWVRIDEAIECLAFESEKEMVRRALELLNSNASQEGR